MSSAAVELDDMPCYAAGYSLDLYCDGRNEWHGWNEFPHQFFGETFGECAKLARKRGWVIHRSTRTATCPKCAKTRTKK
jgi:hypothetical protein